MKYKYYKLLEPHDVTAQWPVPIVKIYRRDNTHCEVWNNDKASWLYVWYNKVTGGTEITLEEAFLEMI